MSTQKPTLAPDAVQHYRIIHEQMETQSEVFETVTHYYTACHSSEKGAFEPSDTDFVRVSAGLHTMGAEWVEIKVTPSEYGYEHAFGLIASANVGHYGMFIARLWEHAIPLMNSEDQKRAKTKTTRVLDSDDHWDNLDFAIRFERKPIDNDGRPIPLHTIPFYIKSHCKMEWMHLCEIYLTCIAQPVTA